METQPFEILVTPHLTLRPLLEVDGDDIRALLADAPELEATMPDDVRLLAMGGDLPTASRGTHRSLAVMREKLIGWIGHDRTAIGFSARPDHAAHVPEALRAVQNR